MLELARNLFFYGFNTQPPEGGWPTTGIQPLVNWSFNTQPPEGGWGRWHSTLPLLKLFQHTAARRRLAWRMSLCAALPLFQHTAARRRLVMHYQALVYDNDRFNTQPPEGGWLFQALPASLSCWSFNTQPPEGGWVEGGLYNDATKPFQHTAARRRLAA